MITSIVGIYVIGLVILYIWGMNELHDITSFHVTVWLCWPVLIVFGVVAIPFLILDMIRTLVYKFRNWRLQVETRYDHDNY